MKNEIERLVNGRGLKTQQNNKILTENLRDWRSSRNIKNRDTKVFIGNVLEELLEIVFRDKDAIESFKNEILKTYFWNNAINDKSTVDAIQDIQVFCINETELMGYDNLKCNDEVFKEINSRKQDPKQAMEWSVNGSSGKWKKWQEQPKESLYKAKYEVCKL